MLGYYQFNPADPHVLGNNGEGNGATEVPDVVSTMPRRSFTVVSRENTRAFDDSCQNKDKEANNGKGSTIVPDNT